METPEMHFRSLGNHAILTMEESGKIISRPATNSNARNKYSRSAANYANLAVREKKKKTAPSPNMQLTVANPEKISFGLSSLSSLYALFRLLTTRWRSHSCNRTPALWHVTIQCQYKV